MRLMGSDHGFAVTGYGVVERGPAGTLSAVAVGAIRTPAGTPQATRLAFLRDRLAELLAAYPPDTVALERIFFNANVKSAMAVGQASGVALVAAADAGVEVTDYTPLEVKQSVVGVGSAAKSQVQAMVAALLRLPRPPTPPDAADACALAICHINRSRLGRAIARAEAAR